MKRSLKYPGANRYAVKVRTKDRHEDTDRGTLWTESEIQWLMDNYETKPVDECARYLRRSEGAVTEQYARCQAAIVENIAAQNFNPGKLWQGWERDWLRENFGRLGIIVCAQRLKRSPHSIRAQAESLGLSTKAA